MFGYPFIPEALVPALSAAGQAVSCDVAQGAWMEPEGVPRMLACGLVASAPHVGAAALLDFADELHGVCEPTHPYRVGDLQWSRWRQARALRERAWRLVNWKRDDKVETVGRHRRDRVADRVADQVSDRVAEVPGDDTPTMRLPVVPAQRVPVPLGTKIPLHKPAGHSFA